MSANHAWARALVAGLAANGVRHVALSPGSRSTPLAVAAHAHPDLDVTVHIDERSGGHFAVGAAKASGTPAAVVCTSGTAAANYLPAVVEADADGTPLLVVTADRPPELRGTGANQTIDQVKLYGDRVRAYHGLGLPEEAPEALAHVAALAASAVAQATGARPGPVHLNVPFRKPLEPTAEDLKASAGPRPPRATPSTTRVDAAALDRVAQRIRAGGRGAVVVGRDPGGPDAAGAILDLVDALGCPVLADPLSGLRETGADVMRGYDAWLEPTEVRHALGPEWVLQFGAPAVSERLNVWVAEAPAFRAVVDPRGRRVHTPGAADETLIGDAAHAATALARRLTDAAPADAQWARHLAAVEAAARGVLDAEAPWEGTIPAATASGLGAEDALFLSNSQPVRDYDRYWRPTGGGHRVLANRGASGIDGVVSAAAGVARATAGRTRLVVGDVALHHDANGLAAARRHAPGLQVVVVDNGGGAIFDRLPIAKAGVAYEELFRTPPDLDVEALAAAYRLPYERVDGPDALGDALDGAGGGIVEVPVDPEEALATRRRLADAVAAAVRPVVAPDAA